MKLKLPKRLIVVYFIISQLAFLKLNAKNNVQSIFSMDRNSFIENKGQWNEHAKFLSKLNGKDVWITKEGLIYDYYELKRVEREAKTSCCEEIML